MRTYAFVGGILGLIVFLSVGLLPAIVYGGFAGVALAGAIFGTPLSAGLLAKGVILFGMTVGLLSTAALFTVAGAVFGIGTGAIVGALNGKEDDMDTVFEK